MIKSFRLYFLTDKKNIISINVPNAKDSANKASIEKAMDEIIESNVFMNEKGTIESKYKACLITKDTIPYELD